MLATRLRGARANTSEIRRRTTSDFGSQQQASHGVQMVTERRHRTRTNMRQPALIVFGDLPAVHPCTVQDVTTEGARVQLAPDLAGSLPDVFDLSFDECRTLRRCRVVWREQNRIGISWN